MIDYNINACARRLVYTFQDSNYLYLCMEMASGGELLKLIRDNVALNTREGRPEVACTLQMAQFYIGELILALEHIHSLNIVHLDIKPESKF